MGGVCVRDMTASGGSDVDVACEVEADTEVDRVCSSSSSNMELHVAYRGIRVKARWYFDAIVTCNVNKY